MLFEIGNILLVLRRVSRYMQQIREQMCQTVKKSHFLAMKKGIFMLMHHGFILKQTFFLMLLKRKNYNFLLELAQTHFLIKICNQQ